MTKEAYVYAWRLTLSDWYGPYWRDEAYGPKHHIEALVALLSAADKGRVVYRCAARRPRLPKRAGAKARRLAI